MRVIAVWLAAGTIWASLVLGLSSCAKMGAPPGGPEDKSGPFLVSHYPDADATQVPRRMVARLEFSEPVNRSSVETSLFLSPDPLQRLRYRWRGQVLELDYLDELEEDRTYVISVGNQAKDLRGNPTGETFTIAFATGHHIDRGRIDGWIAGESTPQSVSIWAFGIGPNQDADPSRRSPDYSIEPDEAGRFHLEYMRAGTYRVFAVADRNRDNLWNPSAEPIGIPPWDVAVSDTTVSWVSFRLARQDTAPPGVRITKEIHPQEIQLRTTEPADLLSAQFRSQAGDTVSSLDFYADPKEPESWHVFPTRPLAAGDWTVQTSGRTRMGRPWTDVDSLEIRERADTTKPTILFSDPPAKGRARSVLPFASLIFEEPVTVDSVGVAGAVLVSSGLDTMKVVLTHPGVREVRVVPDTAFVAGDYTLTLNGTAIHDLAGNMFGDSTAQLRFGFFSPDSLGSLRVRLAAPAGLYGFDLYTIKNHDLLENLSRRESDEILFSKLTPGQYVMEIYHDINADSTYNYGRVSPWEWSEPFVLPPDTISIRARWEQEIALPWPVNPK